MHEQQPHTPADTTVQEQEHLAPELQAQAEQRSKTLAVRIDENLHAQLRFIAQLTGSSITEEIRRAITHRITTAQDDPDLIARAQQVRDEIEREAAARAAAIAGFIGKPAIDSSTEMARRPARPGRGTHKASDA